MIAMWYRRQEVQKRSSLFFNSAAIAGAFGGLLASAIGKLDGVRGYRGWRWVFILGMWDIPHDISRTNTTYTQRVS